MGGGRGGRSGGGKRTSSHRCGVRASWALKAFNVVQLQIKAERERERKELGLGNWKEWRIAPWVCVPGSRRPACCALWGFSPFLSFFPALSSVPAGPGVVPLLPALGRALPGGPGSHPPLPPSARLPGERVRGRAGGKGCGEEWSVPRGRAPAEEGRAAFVVVCACARRSARRYLSPGARRGRLMEFGAEATPGALPGRLTALRGAAVSDKLFTGFLEGASAIFQSVKVAFLPAEQCLIVVVFFLPSPKREKEGEEGRDRGWGGGEAGGSKGVEILPSTNAFGNIFLRPILSPPLQIGRAHV